MMCCLQVFCFLVSVNFIADSAFCFLRRTCTFLDTHAHTLTHSHTHTHTHTHTHITASQRTGFYQNQNSLETVLPSRRDLPVGPKYNDGKMSQGTGIVA